jgi:ribose 5-phosphate isomerase B
MKIVIASDHGGCTLRQSLVQFLKERNIEVEDLGTDSEASVDYPDFAVQVAERVSQGQAEAGVLVCGTGIGMSIVANKFKGVRAAVITDPFTGQMAKEHNNANVVCLGEHSSKPEPALETLKSWLDAQFEGEERHQRRLDKISALETKNFK